MVQGACLAGRLDRDVRVQLSAALGALGDVRQRAGQVFLFACAAAQQFAGLRARARV